MVRLNVMDTVQRHAQYRVERPRPCEDGTGHTKRGRQGHRPGDSIVHGGVLLPTSSQHAPKPAWHGAGNGHCSRRDLLLAKRLYELQAKRDALLSRTAEADRENAVMISRLESALQNKHQEAACADDTILSLRGRISALEGDVSSFQKT